MRRRQPMSTRTDTRCPDTTLFRSSFHRTDRVSAQLRRELGTLVCDAVAEHGLPSVSVSDVEVTRDLAHAKVFVTTLQPERASEARSEEHTSELQSLMRISYAVFCLKQKNKHPPPESNNKLQP